MSQTPFSKEQIELLNQPLDPKRVKHRSGGGGTQLAYLKGHDVINTANQIFGYGNWGYDLLGVELNNIVGDSGEVIGGYYAARVKLTVTDCVPVTEEGVCAVQEGRNPRAKIDAHDMARKGAITDALKRALRCFGDQFGNSLYDTDLIDGQPRNNNNQANRTTNRPAVGPQPANGRSGSAPAAVQPGVTQAQPAPRPAAPVAAKPVAPANLNNGPQATEQQRLGIRRIASNQKLTEQQLEAQIQTRYGCSLDELSAADARDFIQVLQNNAA